MKKVFVAFFSIVISINAISQDIRYRKDERPQNIKDDWYDEYQANRISVLDILMALEIVGVRIFSVPISPAFEKEYNFSVILSEYIDSKKINSQNIIFTPGGKNVYRHSDPAELVFDYIPKLSFITKDDDATMSITTKYYGGSTRRHLKMNKVRDRQFYRWRAYSKTDWKLNEEVPLLIYASSWYDERIKSERFCGVVDLSMDEKETKELLDNSPHYYVISIKVFE